MKRFQDENKRSYNFTEAIAVKCPKCHKQASVTKKPDGKKGYGYTKILACRHCHFSQQGGMIKYKAVVDQYCCNNSEKVNYESQLLNEKPEICRFSSTVLCQNLTVKSVPLPNSDFTINRAL